MSSLNGFNGQQAARPGARPNAEQVQAAPAQSQWQPHPQATQQSQWPQQAPQQGYAPQGYAPVQAGPVSPYGGLNANSDPYTGNFEPYAPAPQRPAQSAYQPQVQHQGYQPQAAQSYAPQGYGVPDPRAQANSWAQQQPAAAPPAAARGFDVGSYLPQQTAAPANGVYGAAEQRQHDSEPAHSDWNNNSQHNAAQGYDFGDAHGGSSNDTGFGQAAGGELEQGYDDEGQEFETEEPRRGRRPMMIAAALVGAIVIGAGGSYGYKVLFHGGPGGTPPMVKSANEPSKTKPADAGGKQFAHTDSKIMGRLGDGASPAASTDAGTVDASGTRKVSTLVVGRDGSIQAPAVEVASAAPVASAPSPAVQSDPGVPGMMVVDALGPKTKTVAAAVAAASTDAGQQVAAAGQAAQKLVVAPPAAAAAAKPVVVANATPDATGSIEPRAAAAAPVVKKAKKVAAAAPTVVAAAAPAVANDAAPVAATSVATGGASGFVAVLASVPRSASSRMDALKRFADMQQKYGGVLGGKTPDVAEANLGAKGAYHRLVVGPPGSREQAGAVCSQLKTQGYPDCWVTSY